jgi:hypothetical protein
MRIGMLRRAVDRLAGLAGGNGPCPCCQDWRGPVLVRDVDFYGDEHRGQDTEPSFCLVCGRRPFTVRIVRDPNFYQNRSRLDEVAT